MAESTTATHAVRSIVVAAAAIHSRFGPFDGQTCVRERDHPPALPTADIVQAALGLTRCHARHRAIPMLAENRSNRSAQNDSLRRVRRASAGQAREKLGIIVC